jgi:hypothetical protein
MKISKYIISFAAYTDDLAVLFSNITSIQPQFNKTNKFCKWIGMDLSINKCAIIGCPNKFKLIPKAFKVYIQSHTTKFKNQPLPVLHQNECYKYLEI